MMNTEARAEYRLALNEYFKAKQKQNAVRRYIANNQKLDDRTSPFLQPSLRGGWYGDFVDHPDFDNPKWSKLLKERTRITDLYPGAVPIRYINYIKKDLMPLSKKNERLTVPNVLVFGLCDSVSCMEEGYKCHICDPYDDMCFTLTEEYDKEYILSLPGKIVVINVYIDNGYQVAYSDACGYNAEVPIELVAEDISAYGDEIDMSGTAYEEAEEVDFGF